MPIEIRELVIKASVTDPAEKGSSGGKPTPSGRDQLSNDALIKACVEKVLEIIKLKNER